MASPPSGRRWGGAGAVGSHQVQPLHSADGEAAAVERVFCSEVGASNRERRGVPSEPAAFRAWGVFPFALFGFFLVTKVIQA